ncbi:MAG: hypothetical protein ACYDAO_09340 [Thermoplasmataceae archaeon]
MAKNKNEAPDQAPESEVLVSHTRRRLEELVVPTFSIKNVLEGQSVFIKILQKLETKPQLDPKTGIVLMDGDTPKTITVARVIDIDTGLSGEMVCPFMLVKGLENFRGDYVGECFEMVKGQKKGRTNEWFVYRIEE